MYYDEAHYVPGKPPTVHNNVVQTSHNPLQGVFLRGYRDYPPHTGVYGEVPDFVADPYAWFLAYTNAEKLASLGQSNLAPDRGHSFHIERHRADSTDVPFTRTIGGVKYTTRNLMFAPYGLSASADFPAGGDIPKRTWADDMLSFAQQGISRSAPAASNFVGSQFLGELHEGLPALMGASLVKGRVQDVMKNAGSEYLNYSFGWAPLVSDIKNLAQTLLDTQSVLARRISEQSKPKRGHWGVPVRTTFRETNPSGKSAVTWFNTHGRVTPKSSSWAPFSALFPKNTTSIAGRASASNVYFLETMSTKRWFDGCFTSYFKYPDIDSSWPEKAASLIQMDLTPEVLWELAPWSWLVDWAFKVQSSIASNSVASNQLLVMNYGYAMERTLFRSMFSGYIYHFGDGYVENPSKVFLTTEDYYFDRLRANPFGFQVASPAGLSANQLAILASLGLSR